MCVIYFKIQKTKKKINDLSFSHIVSNWRIECCSTRDEHAYHRIGVRKLLCATIIRLSIAQTSNAPKHFGCLHGVGALYSLWLSLSSHAVNDDVWVYAFAVVKNKRCQVTSDFRTFLWSSRIQTRKSCCAHIHMDSYSFVCSRFCRTVALSIRRIRDRPK